MYDMMKRKHLESALSSIQQIQFNNPKIELEQYPTSAELASSILWTACYTYNDIGSNKSIIDLGCGTGILAIGAAILDTEIIYAIDCDNDAIQIAIDNTIDMELNQQIHFILAKVNNNNWNNDDGHNANNDDDAVVVASNKDNNNDSSIQKHNNNQSKQKHGGKGNSKNNRGGRGGGRGGKLSRVNNESNSNDHTEVNIASLSDRIRQLSLLDNNDIDDGIPLQSKCVDTVITNPPFGTKNNVGIDIQFLLTACRLARHAVYSFHKSSTRIMIINTIQLYYPQWNIQVIAQMKFDIPKMYSFHKDNNKVIEVDLIRIDVSCCNNMSPENDDNNKSSNNENDNDINPVSEVVDTINIGSKIYKNNDPNERHDNDNDD